MDSHKVLVKGSRKAYSQSRGQAKGGDVTKDIKPHKERVKEWRKRIDRIMALDAKQVSKAEIGRKFGVSRERIGQIINNERKRLGL